MTWPSTVEEAAASAAAAGAELRAGGTDVTARDRGGLATGPFVDLRGITELQGVTWRPDGSARIGAMTTVAAVAADPRLAATYPALTATAATLATPQIRAAATLGGNLLQRNRCWYFRNPHFSCHQTGGSTCPARAGDHRYAAVFDQGPCIAPHPSSLAAALLVYDATVDVTAGRARTMPVQDLYGDGSDPSRDHHLGAGDVLRAVELPAPAADERGAYHRATARSDGEWPLVEVAARIVVTGGVISTAAVAAGAVARTPVRLTTVETALAGQPAHPPVLEAAAARAADGCSPLPQTRYKAGLLRAATLEVLEKAVLERATDGR